jgi:hypothetical protein
MDTHDRWVHRAGWGVIVSAWLTTGYLFAYYIALYAFGADRLHRTLGDGAYSALIATGGFQLLFMVGVFSACWALPFLICLGISVGLLRRVPRQPRLLAAYALSTVAVASLPFVFLDGWPGALLPLMLEDDTEFASGYSPLRFWLIGKGMTREEVIARLGEPLERGALEQSGEQVWRWSRSPHDSSYRIRAVLFRDVRVVETHSEFYVD